MQCPRCEGQLVARLSHGVEVDVCGGCGGVWLDRGELENLMASSEPTVLATSTSSDSVQDGAGVDAVAQPRDSGDDDDDERPKKSQKKKSKSKKSKKKRTKGWADQLEDIFDDVLDWD